VTRIRGFFGCEVVLDEQPSADHARFARGRSLGHHPAERRPVLSSRREWLFEQPTYTIREAAGFLYLPAATLRSWVAGRDYPTEAGPKRFRPIVRVRNGSPILLSFVNLVEAHVLSAIRREHGVSLSKVRRALSWLERHVPSPHPLADHELQTDKLDLFIEHYGGLINVSRHGQVEMRRVVVAYLARIDRNPNGIPIRLYPFTRCHGAIEPKPVVIDPEISFGRPVLVGTGIPTETVAERFNAGETIDELAEDYGRRRDEIEEAIRFERHTEAA
jgi:uncharacterized protein (DUF433 family)